MNPRNSTDVLARQDPLRARYKASLVRVGPRDYIIN